MNIVITGMGVFCPSGTTTEALMSAILSNTSAVRALPADEAIGLQAVAGAVCPDVKLAPEMAGRRLPGVDQISLFSVVAAAQALSQAELPASLNRENMGLVWGCSVGGMSTVHGVYVDLLERETRRVRPTVIPYMMPSAPAFHVGQQLGLLGPSSTISAACASSAVALIEGCRLLRLGEASAVLVGGVESTMSPVCRRAWQATTAISLADAELPESSCRPFSASRTGFAVSEGAAALVLETEESALARGATILGWVRGYGHGSDVGHMLSPDPQRQSIAMRAALAMAAVAPADIVYVNAHGTATQAGDKSEAQALSAVFGAAAPSLPVSSTKAMHGHLIGAAGALEAIITLEALRRRQLPGNPFSQDVDPDLPVLNVFQGPLAVTRAGRLYGMSNSFAFGGVNTSLVLEAKGAN